MNMDNPLSYTSVTRCAAVELDELLEGFQSRDRRQGRPQCCCVEDVRAWRKGRRGNNGGCRQLVVAANNKQCNVGPLLSQSLRRIIQGLVDVDR